MQEVILVDTTFKLKNIIENDQNIKVKLIYRSEIKNILFKNQVVLINADNIKYSLVLARYLKLQDANVVLITDEKITDSYLCCSAKYASKIVKEMIAQNKIEVYKEISELRNLVITNHFQAVLNCEDIKMDYKLLERTNFNFNHNFFLISFNIFSISYQEFLEMLKKDGFTFYIINNDPLVLLIQNIKKIQLKEQLTNILSKNNVKVLGVSSIYSNYCYIKKAYNDLISNIKSKKRISNINFKELSSIMKYESSDILLNFIEKVKLKSKNEDFDNIVFNLHSILVDYASIKNINFIDLNSVHLKMKNLSHEKMFNYFTKIALLLKKHRFNLVENVLNYLDDNFENCDLSVDSLAELFNVSNSHLTKSFKKSGFSIQKYIYHKRMSKAKELLSLSNLSIKEVSKMCGYVNVSYFSTSFKKYTDKTPKEYRQMLIHF